MVEASVLVPSGTKGASNLAASIQRVEYQVEKILVRTLGSVRSMVAATPAVIKPALKFVRAKPSRPLSRVRGARPISATTPLAAALAATAIVTPRAQVLPRLVLPQRVERSSVSTGPNA